MVLIALLVFATVSGTVCAAMLLQSQKHSTLADLFETMDREAGLTRDDQTAHHGLLGWLTLRLGRFMPAAVFESYAERLLWAGRPYGLDAGQFVVLKLILAVGLPVSIPVLTLFQASSRTLIALPLAALAGFVMPDVILGARLAQRRRQVAAELPLFTDLTAAATEAGLPLTEAVRRVAEDAPGLVAREFLRSVQEMAAGKPRVQAWRDLVDRVPGDDLRAIVTAIMQAEQYGTKVSDILRFQVQQIRLFKQQEAQRIAQAATVKMRVPMLLLILLPFMVLLLGPALLEISTLLK